MYEEIKERVYEIIEKDDSEDRASIVFDIFLIVLILLNILAIILASVKTLGQRYTEFFTIFELVSIVIFTVEYLLRIWTANVNKKFQGIIKGRIKYALTPLALFDLFSIIPFFIPFLSIDLRFLRIARLIRVFRIFKFSRYLKAFQIIINVIKKKRGELFVTLMIVIMLILIISVIIYELEKNIQPDEFKDIPAAFLWAISAFTTIDFGMRPLTTAGKFLTGIIGLLGIGIIALPAGILSSGLIEELQKKKKVKKRNSYKNYYYRRSRRLSDVRSRRLKK